MHGGADYRELGLIQFIAAVATIATQMMMGRLLDTMGAKKPVFVAGLLLLTPVVLFYPRVSSLAFMGFLFVLHEIIHHSSRLTLGIWVSNWTARETMGRTHGLFRIGASLGWIVAAPFLGMILDRSGTNAAFNLTAVIYLAVGILVAIFVRERVAGRESAATATERPARGGPAAGVIWTAELKLFLLAFGIFSLAQSIGSNLNTVFLVDELGASNVQFGWIMSVQAWLEVPLMLWLGIISDRLSPAPVLTVAILVSAMRWGLLALVRKTVWAFAIQALHAAGVTDTEVLATAFLARTVPHQFLGTFLALKISVESAARVLAPMLAGNIAHNLGVRSAFTTSGLLAAGASAILWWAYRSMATEDARLNQ